MRQYTHLEFARILKNNGFFFARQRGSHFIYNNSIGKHISIPRKLESVIARRLIKEFNLII